MHNQIDINDPDMIREIARKHWEAINLAIATDGNLEIASRPQMEFLEHYLPSLPADTAKAVLDIYSNESLKHAAEAKRISAIQLEKAKQKAALAARVKRNALLISGLMVLLLIGKLIAMSIKN